MGAQCQPPKPPPPPTGLSIAPTSKDFGAVQVSKDSDTATFTVTNNGPDTSGKLTVALSPNFNPTDFHVGAGDNNCTGQELAAGKTCTVGASFIPQTVGQKQAELVAESDKAADGTATATLTGNGTP